VLVDQSLTVLSLDPETKYRPEFFGLDDELSIFAVFSFDFCSSFAASTGSVENSIPDSFKHFDMETSASAVEKSMVSRMNGNGYWIQPE
jgi:hypothetical protein